MGRPGAAAACLALICGLTAGSATAGLLPSLPSTPTLPAVPTVSVPGTPSLPGTPTLPITPTLPVTPTLPGGTTTTTTTPTTPSVPVDPAGTISDVLGGVLGSAPGSSGGSLPPGQLNTVLQTLLGGGAGSVAGGGSTSSGTDPSINAASGSDHSAPRVAFTVVSKLRQAARTGRLRLRVTANEPAVVAFTTLIRPGRALRSHGHLLQASRKLIRVRAAVVVFHSAGAHRVTVKLPARARRALARVRDARLALQSWTSDVARNQARRDVRRIIR